MTPIVCARCGRTIPEGDAWEKTTEDEKVCAEGQCKPPTLYDRIRARREQAAPKGERE